MSGRSAVFGVGRAVYDSLDRIVWPVNPVTGRAPVVTFGDVGAEFDDERIVVGVNPEETVSEWVLMSPPQRNEIVVLDVAAVSVVPAPQTSLDLWNRLAEMSGLIESVVYDEAANSMVPLDLDGEILLGKVRAVRPYLAAGSDGFVGSVTTSFEFHFRI